ncbi:NAD(P)H-binding protein [Actinophytocola sp.]|uniref:NAD(P)H-binding protein n=1 Tax=Actinophytocola sp. TaxID=1872138 RepID=UPI002D690760|nr:NAD(P)H-binding protein [Actinophytocola sp.]HYQ70036.1 NAD(P)H-binding protein [Actinophytocola sp.]
MRILVTGATGQVGRHVVAQLVEAGCSVVALTRRADADLPAPVEVVRGDLLAPASVPFDGVSRMFLFPEPRTAREVVARAVEAGVSRIVTLSSGAVTGGFDTDFQLPVEQAVEASGVAWTHLRPGDFASNTLRLWGPMIRSSRVVRFAQPAAPSLAIHEADIAAVGVAALLSDGHAGRWYDLTGPALITRREQVAAIGEALGEEVRFEEVDAAEAREILRAQGGWAAANADFLLGFADYSAGGPSFEDVDWSAALTPLPTVEEVLGRPPRTFAQWARDNVAAFR